MSDAFSSVNFVYALLTGLLSGAVVLGGFLVKVGRRMEKIDTLEDSQQEVKKDVSQIGRRIDSMEVNMALKVDIESLRDIVISVRSGLVQAGVLKEAFLTSASPIALTDLGRKALEESGFSRLFQEQKNRDKLLALIDAQKPDNAYEVQEAARKAMQMLIDDPMIDGIKLYVFRQGKPLTDVLSAAGIFVRDQYLDSHPEIAR